jgi:hypothetical protein
MRQSWLVARIGLFATVLAVGGCVTARFVPTGPAHPARAVDCDLEIYSSALPDRPYEEIGIVEGEGDWWKADLEDVLPRLSEEACLAGGDGIILFSIDNFAEGDEGIRVQRVSATVFRWSADR